MIFPITLAFCCGGILGNTWECCALQGWGCFCSNEDGPSEHLIPSVLSSLARTASRCILFVYMGCPAPSACLVTLQGLVVCHCSRS
jgi:hypothetical protein